MAPAISDMYAYIERDSYHFDKAIRQEQNTF